MRKVLITSDKKYVVGSSDDYTVGIWNVKEKILETVLEGHTGRIYCLVLTSDNYIVSGSDDCTVRSWSLINRKNEAILKGHTKFVRSLAAIRNGKYMISCSLDNTARVWKLKKNHHINDNSIF